VVTATGQILDTSAANEHNAVFLQIVSLAGDVRCCFDLVGKPDSGYFAKRGVGLLGGSGSDRRANASLLRRIVVGERSLLGIEAFEQCGGGGFSHTDLPTFAYQLVKCGHVAPPFLFLLKNILQQQKRRFCAQPICHPNKDFSIIGGHLSMGSTANNFTAI